MTLRMSENDLLLQTGVWIRHGKVFACSCHHHPCKQICSELSHSVTLYTPLYIHVSMMLGIDSLKYRSVALS
jgi:hypothetical protein